MKIMQGSYVSTRPMYSSLRVKSEYFSAAVLASSSCVPRCGLGAAANSPRAGDAGECQVRDAGVQLSRGEPPDKEEAGVMVDVSHRCSGLVARDQGDTGDIGVCIPVACYPETFVVA